jgi:hypothetical protein
MVLVALVAVGLIVPGEIRNRRERRHLARTAFHYQAIATAHDKEWAVCEANSGRRCYDEYEREWILIHFNYTKPEFKSWADEAAWHAGKAVECRERASSYVKEEQRVRRRLLLPVLRDIKERSTS